MKTKLLGVAAALAFLAAISPAVAVPLPFVDQGSTTYDPNTGLVWLDVNATVDMSFNDVQANSLGPSQPYAGYRYATVAEVDKLFVDAGITNFSNHAADNFIASLLGLLGGPTFLPGPGFAGLGGMTGDEPSIDTSYVYYMILMSGTDAFTNNFAGLGGIIRKAAILPADFIGSFLVRDLRGSDPVATTPLSAALPLFATGLGALALLARRRKQKKVAAFATA